MIQVLDKQFEVSIPESEIRRQVGRVASEITRDYEGQTPVFLAILNGSFIFAADLLREVSLPCEVSFVKLASYEGVNSTGRIHEMIGLNVDITDRPVIIIEDIVESGLTMAHMLETLRKHNPRSIDVCTLFLKPNKLKVQLASVTGASRYPMISSWATASTTTSRGAIRRIYIPLKNSLLKNSLINEEHYYFRCPGQWQGYLQ